MIVFSRQNVRVKTKRHDRPMMTQKNQKILGLVHSDFVGVLNLFLEHSRTEFAHLKLPVPVEEGGVCQQLEALFLEFLHSVELPVPTRHRY